MCLKLINTMKEWNIFKTEKKITLYSNLKSLGCFWKKEVKQVVSYLNSNLQAEIKNLQSLEAVCK